MNEFNPSNTYKYSVINYHGITAIHVKHKKIKDLDFIFPSLNIDEARDECLKMEACRRAA